MARMRTVSEKDLQRQVVEELRWAGCRVYVLGTRRRRGDHQGTMQSPGIPDLYFFAPRILGGQWVEMKSAGGRLSVEQVAFASAAQDTGTPWHCWRGREDARRWLLQQGLCRMIGIAASYPERNYEWVTYPREAL